MPFINDMINNNETNNKSQPLINNNDNKFISKFSFNPSKIIKNLKHNIIGQDNIFVDIENMLWMVKSGISNKEKPLAVNLLIGNTGVGKTETVKLISKEINNKNDYFCRIDMNTLSQAHYSASIVGSPPGYVGSKESITMFDIDKIQGSFSRPGIVLFDEIEKANKEVIRSLLNILDYGILNLSSGNKIINFRNSIIFMTSNIGTKELINYYNKLIKYTIFFKFKSYNKKKEYQIILKELEKKFDPEFINRIDWKLFYNNLNKKDVVSLIKLEIKKLNDILNLYDINIIMDDKAYNILIDKFDTRYGARDIARIFRTIIEPQISKILHLNNNCKNLIIMNKNNHLIVANK